MCCYEFNSCGLYHFALSETSSQLISIIVSRKPKHHQVDLQGEDSPIRDFLDIEIQDYVWFAWEETLEPFSHIHLISKCLPRKKLSSGKHFWVMMNVLLQNTNPDERAKVKKLVYFSLSSSTSTFFNMNPNKAVWFSKKKCSFEKLSENVNERWIAISKLEIWLN